MEPHVLLGTLGDGPPARVEDLEQAGFRVTRAHTTLEFLQLCRSAAPDALVLDTRLPWHSPPVVCRLLRAQPHIAGIPLLVLVAAEERPLGEQCLEAGADRVLDAALPGEGLIDRLRQAMAARPDPVQGPAT